MVHQWKWTVSSVSLNSWVTVVAFFLRHLKHFPTVYRLLLLQAANHHSHHTGATGSTPGTDLRTPPIPSHLLHTEKREKSPGVTKASDFFFFFKRTKKIHHSPHIPIPWLQIKVHSINLSRLFHISAMCRKSLELSVPQFKTIVHDLINLKFEVSQLTQHLINASTQQSSAVDVIIMTIIYLYLLTLIHKCSHGSRPWSNPSLFIPKPFNSVFCFNFCDITKDTTEHNTLYILHL